MLDPDVLEVSPLGKDLHCLNVLDGCQLITVVFVATKRVQVDLLTEAFVLALHDLQDVQDLFTVVHFLVIDTYDRVENGPHYFWVVNSSEMIFDIQAENNLVKL